MNLLLAPTTTEWWSFTAIFCGLGAFVLAAEFIRSRFNGSPELTRKLVHIATGMLICFTPSIFVSGVPPMLLAALFICINFLAVRTGVLKGIHGTNRISFGTVYYPLSFFILILLTWDTAPYFLSIAMLILAIGDAAAAIVGENLGSPHQYNLTSDKKSIEGSATMFIVSWGVAWLGIMYFIPAGVVLPMHSVLIALVLAIFVTAWEGISSKGLDNLTVPLSAGFVLDYFITPLGHHNPSQFVGGIIFGAIIAIISHRLRLLTSSGAVATFLLAVIIFGIGGWLWTLPLLVFFAASSALSKFGGKKKKSFESLYEKTGVRDAGQVAANGGIAGMLAVLWYMFPSMTFLYVGFIGAIAAATADTWGTEIGTLSRGETRSIVSFMKVEKGTSGGVSLAGLIGGCLGALCIAISAIGFSQAQSINYLIQATVVAGIIGTLTDSILGATIQARFQCMACGKDTERKNHCVVPTRHVSGVKWMNNDLVNAACAAAGSATAMLLYI